jgi:hypothetical protein
MLAVVTVYGMAIAWNRGVVLNPKRRKQWPVTPEGRCRTLADPCVPKVPRCDAVRWTRCRRQAQRQGRELLRHMRTGLITLDGIDGWTFDELETELFS